MINRFDLVTRHNPTMRALDPLSPLSVGNGEFVFTADITGLQTFADAHEDGMPLHTMSQWAWHSTPQMPIPDDAGWENFEFDGRLISYLSGQPQGGDYLLAEAWLRANPHRLDLGRLGFILHDKDGREAAPGELTNIEQTLDLWGGVLRSAWTWLGESVRVETVCHPDLDCVAVRVHALNLVGKLGLKLAFPYGREDWKRAADWENEAAHRTTIIAATSSAVNFERTLDDDNYYARWQWNKGADLRQSGAHQWELWPQTETFEFVLAFAPQPIEGELPTFEETREAARAHWAAFWENGAALDLSGSRDERAPELERRVVLSQYQTAINCAGSAPPAETGLVCNSWFGKFHLEMHPWHAAHFALWNRAPLLEKSLGWYRKILPVARENAARQGFAGARWPKMVALDGRDSPSGIGVFLLWQQAHPLILAEMCYAARGDDREWLEKYAELVFPTAEFIADYARRDPGGRYSLKPPLIPAQESYGRWKRTNCNPTFELALWHYALGVAQIWRERLGLERVAKWDEIRDDLARPTVKDGIYQAMETEPFLIRRDHPSMLCALGVLPPTPLIDAATMEKTLESVLGDWDWASTWGWDYPVMAMTAARVGRADLAIESLLLDAPKNHYLPNGHNYQEPRLPLYLPGNGGLLLAVALMAGGWKDAPSEHAPGFPQDGSWCVQSEGFVMSP